MPKFTVYGMIGVSVSVEVEAEDEDDALDKADEEFGGVTSFAGNGGHNKLIGVSGTHESIEAGEGIEWESADEL